MSKLVSVLPQANVSRVVFDTVPDDSASAFIKYNNHQHNPVVVPDFTAYDVRIGDEVYLYGLNGSELFPLSEPAVVEYISPGALRLSQSCLEDVENGILYYRAPRQDTFSRLVYCIKAEAGSQIVTFDSNLALYDYQQFTYPGISGFLTQAQAQSLIAHTVAVTVVTQAGRDIYPIIPFLGFKAWLMSVSVYSVDADTAFFVQAYSPQILDHVFAEPETWDVISPEVGALTALRFQTTCIPTKEEEDLDQPYPSNRPQRCLPADSMLSLKFDSVPAGKTLYIALHFNRVLND